MCIQLNKLVFNELTTRVVTTLDHISLLIIMHSLHPLEYIVYIVPFITTSGPLL